MNKTDYRILVNGENRLPEGFENTVELVSAKNAAGTEFFVEKKTYEAFLRLREDLLKNDGLQAELISSYRSVPIQEKIFQERLAAFGEEHARKYVAVPGHSEHHTGLVASLSLSKTGLNLKMSERPELLEMCHRYGFIQRYPEDKADRTDVGNYGECLRYVGVAHAAYMAQNNLCMEEYVELLKKNHVSTEGSDGKHLAVDTNGDGTADYAVYYVPKNQSTDLTTVYVPKGMEYTVSGDNMGGFIVTVTLHS
jgi:D-alanyl-D-alanine carboxypeptidase